MDVQQETLTTKLITECHQTYVSFMNFDLLSYGLENPARTKPRIEMYFMIFIGFTKIENCDLDLCLTCKVPIFLVLQFKNILTRYIQNIFVVHPDRFHDFYHRI